MFSYAFERVATKMNLCIWALIVESERMPRTCGTWNMGQNGKHNGYTLVVFDYWLQALFKTSTTVSSYEQTRTHLWWVN
jgi:hypothetical protein